MLRNHLILAWRNLVKHIGPSLINIFGLSAGVAACLLLFLYVRFETSYDTYNQDADKIVRVTTTLHGPDSDLRLATTPAIMAPTLQREYPDIAAAAHLTPVSGDAIIKFDNTLFREPQFFETDSQVFSVFTFSFLEGARTGCLNSPRTVVLTRSMEKKYFGAQPALGKTLICNGQPLRVSAVIADRPPNSDLQIDALVYKDLSSVTSFANDDFSTYTFVRFHQKPDPKAFAARLRQFSKKYVQPEFDTSGAQNYRAVFEVETLKDVHYSQDKMIDAPKGNRQFNILFSLLAVFILFIALLNYINLSTARAAERAKEVGVRKVNGASQPQLIRQFLLESFLLVLIAWIISLALVWGTLPYLNSLLGTKLPFTLGDGNGLWIFLGFVATVLLAGAYPAFVLSSFRPSHVLKGSWRRGPKGILLRKILTVVQFTITAALLTGAVVIYSQMRYITHTSLGFSANRVLTLRPPPGPESKGLNTAFLEALRAQPYVEGISGATGLGALSMGSTQAYNNGAKEDFMCNYLLIDPSFLSLLKIPLLAGRNLSADYATDPKQAFLVNEAFVRKMRWTSPLGQKVKGMAHEGVVVGVVKDFHYMSLHNVIAPLALVYQTETLPGIELRMPAEDLTKVQKIWEHFYPSLPFNYSFVEDDIKGQYQDDRTTMHLFHTFTLLAIIISCLGLYGLISITVLYRTKEIGVRKVLGASLISLVSLLLRDSIRLTLLSACVALPVAGIVLHRWLSSYAYHIPLFWWMFALPFALIIAFALSVTGYQVIRAARANPVESLRAD
jgi:putative ABC transport system permease protein